VHPSPTTSWNSGSLVDAGTIRSAAAREVPELSAAYADIFGEDVGDGL